MSDKVVQFRPKARPKPVLVKDDRAEDRATLRRVIDACYYGLIEHSAAKALQDIKAIVCGEKRG